MGARRGSHDVPVTNRQPASPPAPTRRLSGPVVVVSLHASPCVLVEGDVISPPGDRRAPPLAGCGAEERGWYRREPVDANRVATGQRTLKPAKPYCASTGFTEAKIWHFLGSAARQRLLAIASAFDLNGPPHEKLSSSTSLVRKRSPFRRCGNGFSNLAIDNYPLSPPSCRRDQPPFD
jgi:hypothetical protein